MKRSIHAAILQISGIILIAVGNTVLVPLYGHCSPQQIGALVTIFGAVFFTILMVARRLGRTHPTVDRKKLRSYWPIIAVILLAGLPQSQVKQAALSGAGVDVLTAVTTAGLLGLTAWRLIFPEGRFRPRHAVWPVIALGGVLLLVNPFGGHEPSAGGIAAAVLLSGIDIAFAVSEKKLADQNVLTQSMAIMRWACVVLVAVPILALGDQRWMSMQVIAIVAAATSLTTLSNWIQIPATKLAPSDGFIAALSAGSPVLAALIALIAGQSAPGPWGWVGAAMVAAASAVASWILDRAKHGHPADPKNTQ